MRTTLRTDLEAVAAFAMGREGVVWTLDASDELNANLVHFGVGRGIGEHVNDKVDVVFVGVSGTGLSKPMGKSTLWALGSWSSSPETLAARPGACPRTSPTSPSTGGVGHSGSEPKQTRR